MALKLVVENAESVLSPEQKKIADAVIADATYRQLEFIQEALSVAESISERIGGDMSVEAGMLKFVGKEYPVIGLRRNGKVNGYTPGESCSWFFFRLAMDEDLYRRGPAVSVVQDSPQDL